MPRAAPEDPGPDNDNVGRRRTRAGEGGAVVPLYPPPAPDPRPPPPVQDRPDGAWWAWRQLHGGAGTSTLSQAVPGGIEIREDPSWPAFPVVAVCRSHATGLEAAQRWAAAQALTPTVVLAGLVVVADAPGRLPRSLETVIRLVTGGYPRVWRLPWIEEWRRGQPVTVESIPAPYRALLSDLANHTGMNITPPGDESP